MKSGAPEMVSNVQMARGSPHFGPAFIKSDQVDPWVKDKLEIIVLSVLFPLHLQNVVMCERAVACHKSFIKFHIQTLIYAKSWPGLGAANAILG